VMRPRPLFQLLALFGVAALVLSACGGSSKKKSSAAGGSGGTLTTLAQAAAPGSPDPQINYTLQEWQMLIMTHDGLTAFKKAGGLAGTQVVPDLSTSSVIADDANHTVTFPLTSADPEFLQKLAVPFAPILPPSTPMKAVQIPPPGTGPYKFVEYNLHKGIKLVRNPFFKVWSKDA